MAVALSACAIPTLGPAPVGEEHDGYVLVCEHVGDHECRRRADEAAQFLVTPDLNLRDIRWITVRPDDAEVCAAAEWGLVYCYWTMTLGSIG